MRKHILFIVAAMAGLAFSSCTEKETFTYHPSDLVAPVLSNLSQADYVLTDGGTFDSFTFSSASVGFSASLQYELFAVLPLDGATPKSLGKVTNGTAIEVSANVMNNILIGWECPADEPVAVNYYVTANWMSSSNKPIGVGATSNSISANVTPFKAEKTYKSIYFRGGFNGWGASEQYKLYCYAEDDNTYMGTVDFDGDGKIADHIAQGFKFADSAWGDINLGSSNTEAEAGIITLVSGGDNIMSYTAHRYYSFEVDIAGLKAYKTYGFDNMGVIGLNGDWDNDHNMTWNPFYGRFYVDVEAPANTEFKFRLDNKWEVDWGQSGVRGGANIPLEAGNYRIYFYFNNFEAPTYEVNAAMYGQEEPKGETPEPPAPEPVWALIGVIGETNWDTDFPLTDNLDGTWSTVATINGGFKIRPNCRCTES